ncbi:hypothetical protein FR773_14740 [Leclercia adecarboxylata]|uniref:hypothetical protein n=1 Tax=Leclercia adecarboxylata TaxID=83655 RepID=UPI0012A88989|nr:hypothetical protein [Leclercia adecarboxylata]QFH65894.1 hypothetical protein FR773_14740 [Leclercia adecarboxylata]
MTTKRQAEKATDDALNAFLSEASERFKPNADILAQRVVAAVQRYMATNTTQRFNAPVALMMQQLQERILDGWRYDIGIPQSVYLASAGNMSVMLRKPAALVEQQIADIKRQVEDSYHDELANAMEYEVDKLVQDAANVAQRLAEEAAAAERDAMRQRMRDMLLTRAAV